MLRPKIDALQLVQHVFFQAEIQAQSACLPLEVQSMRFTLNMRSISNAYILISRRPPPNNNVQTAIATARSDNILTGLFPSPNPDCSSKGNIFTELQSFHRQALGRLFPNGSGQLSDGEFSDSSDTQSGQKTLTDQPDMPPKLFINAHQTRTYFVRYESLVAYFPFVALPAGWTVQSMLKDHPFLVLGILTAMSQEDGHLHFQLDAEFRKILSEKVTMNGEKSLDILQGLLVHIAWYALRTCHFVNRLQSYACRYPQHLRPRNSQLRQFLQIAISLLTDLKYNVPPEQDESLSSKCELSERIDGIRAYLGCYYLAAV